MFEVVHVCRHTLDDELIQQWRAHLCGLWLSLRDSRGQLSRALTNTDAVLLSVLVEAQQAGDVERSTAGPCPLRGMRTAQVVPAGAVAARLGATVSMTLAAAPARAVHVEREHRLAPTTVKDRAVGALAGPLRRGALADAGMADAVHARDVLDDLARQGALETAVRPGDPVLAVTAPSSRAAGRIFASSAVLAGRPENKVPLREIGQAFGSLAHLLDAVDDLEADRRSGSFNPIVASGSTLTEVRHECALLVRRIRATFDTLTLRDGRLARALLVDGTHAAVRTAFRSQGGGHSHCSSAAGRTEHLGHPGEQPPSPPPAPPDQDPPVGDPPPYPTPDLPPAPPKGTPAKDLPRPPFWPNVLPWIGVYCTGFACCASHPNPCTGKRHQAGCSGGDWCSSCDCGDDCCCDCDC